MTEIVIASAARTPVGAFNGAFASLPAHALGTAAIKAAMERARIEGAEVDEVILGQILAAGAGQNPARQASVNAGIPVEHTACAPWRWRRSKSPLAMRALWWRAVRKA
jgi:acetyl-CoA C-acetyltransferase